MPIVRGDMAHLLAPGLIMKTVSRYREKPERYRSINNVKTSNKRAYEEDFAVSGLGTLQYKSELGTPVWDEPFKLGLVRYIHQTFALGIAFSQEARDDDQYSFILSLAGELGRSARWTAELWGHDVYNLGFGTSRYIGRDGKALFATDHPVQGRPGLTLANKPTVDTDLSAAALEAAITSFGSIVEERGMPIESVPETLIIHPENEMNAKRLLNSMQYPGSNMNDINVLQNSLKLVVTPYLTDPDAWYIIGSLSDIDINFWWREMPDTKTWDDDNADATMHKIRQRHSVGFGDWRHTYASSGG